MNTLRQLFGKDVLRDFWHWFSKHKDRFYRFEEDQKLLFGALTKKLKQIHPNLTFEFSSVHPDGIRELTISADGIKAAFPFVVQLVDRAPKIDKWKVNAFRQRIPVDDLAIRLGETITIGYNDIFFAYQFNNNLYDVDLHIRNYEDSDGFKSAVFLLLDALVGEYDMEMKVGNLNFCPLEEVNLSSLQPFVKLRSLVDSIGES